LGALEGVIWRASKARRGAGEGKYYKGALRRRGGI